MRRLLLRATACLLLLGAGWFAATLYERLTAAQVYTCPMDEDADVRADAPGPCPRCGMDLEPLAATYHKGVVPEWVLEKRRAQGPAPPKDAPPPKPAEAKASPPASGPQRYYCTMHPQYITDRPGDCPICNMHLEPLEEDAAAEASDVPGMARVRLETDRRQMIGLRLGTVRTTRLVKTIRAPGIVAYDERGLSAVTLKVGGWIEELHVRAVGDLVAKGDPLFTLYSPEIAEAQQSYVIGRQALRAPGLAGDARAAAEADLASARERLLRWDLTDAQLAELDVAAAAPARTVIRARTGGVVTARTIVLGAYAEAGRNLLELADLSTVWINAEIYEHEIPHVKVGAAAEVTLSALPGVSIDARVAFIHPSVTADTRTLKVRIEAPNPGGALKPGMYADAMLQADLGEHLAVDDGAILDTGVRRIVFVDLGDGVLEPREVATGARADGVTAIVAGLAVGERVVTSGNFLIDAESRLKAALLGGGGAQ